MSESAAAQLEAIKGLVEQAKSVPMSASCMVNRSELLGLVDQALSSTRAQEEEARLSAGSEAVAAAHAQADQILQDAQAEAERLVSEDAVHSEAVARASALTEATQADTDALKREADAFVDQRMAELEAVLSKTLGQIKTMRARLSARSGLDEPNFA